MSERKERSENHINICFSVDGTCKVHVYPKQYFFTYREYQIVEKWQNIFNQSGVKKLCSWLSLYV